MTNQYPGYCIECGRDVKRGHGELKKRNGKYVVSCGRVATVNHAPTPPTPKPERPTGNRLSDLKITSSNAALCVSFAVDGIGYAQAFSPFSIGRALKYTRWSSEPLAWTDKPGDAGKSLRELRPEEAVRHDATCAANEALYATLHASEQIVSDSKHEFQFYLSTEEEGALAKLIRDTKAALLAAILDGTATIDVHEVGCDFPHLQVGDITLPNTEKPVEWALMYDLLVHDLGLKIDGKAECNDLAGAIQARQAVQEKHRAELAAHKQRRAAGYHIVILRRCWECGRTQILGELDDDMHEVRMSKETYAEATREQQTAHQRSIEGVTEPLSSVGFIPVEDSKFQFEITGKDWYCGC